MKNVERRIELFLGIRIQEKIDTEEESGKFFRGEISEKEFWQKVLNKYQWKIDIEDLKRLVRENMSEIDGTREIIEKLKQNGYKLGLLSVHGKEWIKYCQDKFDYHKLFHSVMYSFEVGVCKPDPKAFELIIEKLQVNINECIFIDDNSKNIEAARKLGIQVILFENPHQLKLELQNLNIKL